MHTSSHCVAVYSSKRDKLKDEPVSHTNEYYQRKINGNSYPSFASSHIKFFKSSSVVD